MILFCFCFLIFGSTSSQSLFYLFSHHKTEEQKEAQAAAAQVTVDDEAEDYHNMSERIKVAQASVDALAEAKRVTEEFGIQSPEARSAWELVEELAATATHHKTVGSG